MRNPLDDLTPSERHQLHEVLRNRGLEGPQPLGSHVIQSEETDDTPKDDHEVNEEQPVPAAPVIPVPIVKLDTGEGFWQGHFFTLDGASLKSVLSICSAAIAQDLQAEIARINAETGVQ